MCLAPVAYGEQPPTRAPASASPAATAMSFQRAQAQSITLNPLLRWGNGVGRRGLGLEGAHRRCAAVGGGALLAGDVRLHRGDLERVPSRVLNLEGLPLTTQGLRPKGSAGHSGSSAGHRLDPGLRACTEQGAVPPGTVSITGAQSAASWLGRSLTQGFRT